MRGSVVKRDTRYYVKIELDPDPLTGKRRQKWHSGFRTKREAEKARIDLLSKFDRGEYVEPSQQTLTEYLTDWLKAIEHTVRPSTFDSYSRNMHNHVITHIGTTKLVKVDAGVLNGLYALLLAFGSTPAITNRSRLLLGSSGARPGAEGRRPVTCGNRRAVAIRICRGVGDHEEHARHSPASTGAAPGGR